jgi:predicted transposase/invertase (TIGR01784 family)
MATNEPDFESIKISDPIMFASVFTDPSLCKELLEIILEIPIDHVEIISSEHTVVPELGAKGVRLDVYVADGLGTKFNVEMQNVNKHDLERRSRYYLTANDIDCIRRGMLYKDMNDTYVIFICQFDPFKDGLPVYTVTPHCKETGHEMPDGTTRMFLSTVAWSRCENPRLRSFLRYVHEGMIDEETADGDFLRRVDETVRSIRHQAQWRMRGIMNELNERFAEGKAEGKAEGSAETEARMNEEMRLLGERLAADGRASEAIEILVDPGRRARELERYGIGTAAGGSAL